MPLLNPSLVLYYAGPGDVAGTLRYWLAGQRDPRETSLTYSGMVFDIIRDAGLSLVAISRNGRADEVQGPGIQVIHRPPPEQSQRGWRYIRRQLGLLLEIARDVWRYRPSLMLVQEGTIEWPLLIPFWFLGVRMVADLQCSLWPAGHRPRTLRARFRQWMWGLYFKRFAWRTLGISPEIVRQVTEIGGPAAPEAAKSPRGPAKSDRLLLTLSAYVRDDFDRVRQAPTTEPFRVLYAGRIEHNKGVFDLLEVAQQLEKATPGGFEWHLCGDGSHLEALRQAVAGVGAQRYVILHGQLPRERLIDLWQDCHLTLVPTTTGFPEGLNRVAIESVLLYRPAVVTSVVPAWEVLGKAAAVVKPSDVEAMAREVQRLARDGEYYQRMVDACVTARDRFFDSPELWGNVVRRVLTAGLRPRKASTPQEAA